VCLCVCVHVCVCVCVCICMFLLNTGTCAFPVVPIVVRMSHELTYLYIYIYIRYIHTNLHYKEYIYQHVSGSTNCVHVSRTHIHTYTYDPSTQICTIKHTCTSTFPIIPIVVRMSHEPAALCISLSCSCCILGNGGGNKEIRGKLGNPRRK